jgi:hypothetical protein
VFLFTHLHPLNEFKTKAKAFGDRDFGPGMCFAPLYMNYTKDYIVNTIIPTSKKGRKEWGGDTENTCEPSIWAGTNGKKAMFMMANKIEELSKKKE